MVNQCRLVKRCKTYKHMTINTLEYSKCNALPINRAIINSEFSHEILWSLAGSARAGQKGVRLTAAKRRLKISAIPFIQSPSTSGLKFFSAGRPICPMLASRAGRRLSGKAFLLLLLPDKRREKITRKPLI